MSDAQAKVVNLPEPFEAEVITPTKDGGTQIVNRRFRARIVRAETPEEALTAGQVKRQDDDREPAPSSVEDVEQHDWSALSQNLIPPPYNLLKLTQLEEVSNVLRECVDAMATNIEGFGFTFRQRRMTDEFIAENQAEIDKELRMLIAKFQFLCLDVPLTECRTRTRRSTELTGNGYWEVMRSEDKPQQIVQVPSYTVAIGKLDKEFTKYKLKLVDPETFEIIEIERQKKFRRFAQVTSSGKIVVWLKEYGDPRQIDRKTGEVHDPDKLDQDGKRVGDLPFEEQAQEIIHYKIHSDRTPYGIPRWISRLIPILSNRKAEEVNFFTIDTHIPSLMIMVEGGQLTDGSIKRLAEMIETSISMSANRTAFVILEAESAEGVTLLPGQPGTPKIAVKELANSQISEEMYTVLDENGQKKVIRAFRLPQLFVAREEGLTKASGVVSRQLGNEQVFAPERQLVDWIMNRILVDMGARFHIFKSKAPNVTDNAEVIRLMLAAEKSGAMSPRRADVIVTDVMEMPLGPLPSGIDPDTPFSISFAQAQNAMITPGDEGEGETERASPVTWMDLFISKFMLGDDGEEEAAA
jgi:capsid portal protein